MLGFSGWVGSYTLISPETNARISLIGCRPILEWFQGLEVQHKKRHTCLTSHVFFSLSNLYPPPPGKKTTTLIMIPLWKKSQQERLSPKSLFGLHLFRDNPHCCELLPSSMADTRDTDSLTLGAAMLVSGKVSVGLPGGLVGSKMGSLKSSVIRIFHWTPGDWRLANSANVDHSHLEPFKELLEA